ncbi:actin filament capping protein [Aureococcus anophagefferens]|uniref:Actin filament capping protein n=1 Tax=Aureococcus anophagefferens TaxID=44056 RepID=A0ABR1FIC5_AURAN
MEKLSANRDRGHGTLVAKFPNLEGTDFEGCGEDVGLAVWRVVKRKLVRAVDGDEVLGTPRVLRRSDVLLLLRTSGDGRERTWAAHTWKGGSASMIAEGMAGSMAAKLVNLLNVYAGSGAVTRHDSQDGDECAALKDALGAFAVEDGGAKVAAPAPKAAPAPVAKPAFALKKTAAKAPAPAPAAAPETTTKPAFALKKTAPRPEKPAPAAPPSPAFALKKTPAKPADFAPPPQPSTTPAFALKKTTVKPADFAPEPSKAPAFALKKTASKPADFAPAPAPAPSKKVVIAAPDTAAPPPPPPPPGATPQTPRTPGGTVKETEFPNLKGTEFEGAGEHEGLEVWRVRGRKLVRAVDDGRDEIFRAPRVLRKADVVVLLATTGAGRKRRWAVYTWKGGGVGMIASGLGGSMAAKLVNQLEVHAGYGCVTREDATEGGEPGSLKAALGDFETQDGAHEVLAKHADAARPVKLWRLDEGLFVRVEAKASSLSPQHAYVVDAGDARKTAPHAYSWAGAESGRVERALAEEMSRRLQYAEYPDASDAASHAVEGEAGDAVVRALLAPGACGAAAGDPRLRCPTLFAWDGSAWAPMREDGGGNDVAEGGRLAASTLGPGGLFLVDAWAEAWLWRGRSFKGSFGAARAAAASALGPAARPPAFSGVEVVRDRFEPALFGERFYGWGGGAINQGGTLEIGGYVPSKHDEERRSVKLRAVAEEAARMTRGGVGSLAAEGDESEAWISGGAERSGDESRVCLTMDLADDETGYVRVFRVDDDNELLELANSGEGYGVGPEASCWTSSDMIIACYGCKNGALHVVYTWEGDTASLKARTAAGLRVASLKDDCGWEGAEHQLYCYQNAEPALLVTVLRKHLGGHGLLTLRGRTAGGYLREHTADDDDAARGFDAPGGRVRALRVGSPPGSDAQDAELVRAAEEPLETLLGGYRFENEASWVFVKTAPDGSVDRRVAHGNDASPAVRGRAEAVAGFGDLARWLDAACSSGTITALEPTGAGPAAFAPLAPADFGAFGLDSMLYEGLEELATFEDLPTGDDGLFSRTFKADATRPARLFEVSHAKRAVGGMFVTDLGRTFRQQDLLGNNARGTFVLDAGGDVVYVWFGAGPVARTEAALAVAVGGGYAREVPTMDCYKLHAAERDRDASAPTARLKRVHGQHHRASMAPRRDCPDLSVVLVDAGAEPPEFVACFFGWQPLGQGNAFAEAFAGDVAAAVAGTMVLEEDEAAEKRSHEPVVTKTIEDDETMKRRARTLTRGRASEDRVQARGDGEVTIAERLGSKVSTGKRGSLHVAAPQPLTIVEDDEHRGCTIQRDVAALHGGDEDFLVYAYSGKKIVKRLAHGVGGLSALRGFLEADNVCYALAAYGAERLSEAAGTTVHQSVYVFVTWFPPGISPMVRGTVASHKAAIHSIFQPFQVEIVAEDMADLADDKVEKKVVDHVLGVLA